MNFIIRLFEASSSPEELTLFIENNSIEIYDFFISQKNSSINYHRDKIEKYLLPYYDIYSQLDFAYTKNQTFLFCLLDVSQRFGLATEFEQVYNLTIREDVPITSRLRATNRFLIGINSIDDFDNRIPEVLSDLSTSYLKEEDNEQNTIAALIYFYSEVFNNFSHNIGRVDSFRDLLVQKLKSKDYDFLYTNSVKEILSLPINNIEELYQKVLIKLDEILERSSVYPAFNSGLNLIEANSHYSQSLSRIQGDFSEIIDLCRSLYAAVQSDKIFRSLQRGVKVLTNTNQLLAYIFSFGKMHHAKMVSALQSIDSDNFKGGELEIYDWGCGQGLASICFLEEINRKNIKYSVSKFILIEPSEIAIKRASLHIRKFISNSEITTINKDLNSLSKNDFDSSRNSTKIHLFSNILDIDSFSMIDLIGLIKAEFKGNNIFVCVSPYITSYKTDRMDNFAASFKNNLGFEMLENISERKGEWAGTSWSRVIRVFKCIIE